MLAQEVVALLRSKPFLLNNEKKLQADISTALDAAGFDHKREVTLAPGDIVDFMLPGGLAMEIKIKAPKKAIYRQCERYCRHPSVSGLILVSATAIGFPPEINGKPCWVVSLGAAWY